VVQIIKYHLMGILDKSTIEKWITPYLTKGSRGFEPKADLSDIVLVILYRLKTGCQWRELLVELFFKDNVLRLAKQLMLYLI
jgi:transposase